MPNPSPVKAGKLPKARVMCAVSKNFNDQTLILQHKKWGPLLDTPVAVLPTRTKAQAARICRVANMNWRDRQELVANVIDAYNDITNAGETWSAGAEAMAVLNALGLGGEATR